MPNHIVKYTYIDGKKLPRDKTIYWCGVHPASVINNFHFLDASHALLSIDQGQTVSPCKDCIKAISDLISKKNNTI